MKELLLILQIVTTPALAGIIWIIQLVHYPSFGDIDAGRFRDSHATHTRRITPVVAPLMIVELLSSVLLVIYPPALVPRWSVYAGLFLTFVVWLSTFALQVPLHQKLAAGYDAVYHRQLVRTNWLRTAAWTLRTVLVAWFAWVYINAPAFVNP